jgi:hypothetical protein
MAINPNPPGVPPPRLDDPPPLVDELPRADQPRTDRMSPYGRASGGRSTTWLVGGLIVVAAAIALFSFGKEPATQPPTSQTSEETVPTQPAPATPTQPQPTTPTEP